jgi:hypothetical protein
VQVARYPPALGLGHAPEGLSYPPVLGYVAQDIDRHEDRTLFPEDGHRFDSGPSLLSGGEDAEAYYFLNAFLAREGPAPGKSVYGKRLPLFVQDLVPRQDLGGR